MLGMVQRDEDFGFPLEAGQPIGVRRERLGQDLERHVPVELRVAGAIDLAHAALAHQADYCIRADRRTGV